MSYDSLSLAEHHIYGRSRLGIQQYSDTAYLSVYKEGELLENALSTRQPWYSYAYNEWILPTATKPISTTGLLSRYTSDMRSLRILGYRQYELTDHLGNATATILDRRTGYGDAACYYTGYHADLVSALDYYPFGMPMLGRSVDSYRFGFNGQEKVNEISGIGNHNTALFWEYDTRTSRRWNIDPVDQISISNYAINGLNPIFYNDPNGDYKTKFAAQFANIFNGGDGIKQNTDKNSSRYGEWSYGNDISTSDENSVVIKPYDHYGSKNNILDNTLFGIKSSSNYIKNNASNIWNSNLMRVIIPDFYTFSGNLQISSIFYLNEEITFTLLVRGKDPGLYYNTTTGGGVISAMGLDFSSNIGKGYFLTLDPRNMDSKSLGGWQVSSSAGIGLS